MRVRAAPKERTPLKWHFLLYGRQVCATTDRAKQVQLTPDFRRVNCRACSVIYIRRFEEARYE